MRSWKAPALLATIGLCGLGSLFAQDTLLPVPSGAAAVSEPLQPLNIGTSVLDPTPVEVAPAPVPEPSVSWSAVSHDSMDYGPVTDASCGGGCSDFAPPCMITPCQSAPCRSGCWGAAPTFAAASSCGCQSGVIMPGGSGYGYGASYPMGSGSGVSSGVLSPNANSGGLHTRYPYYNYRHPWYYQGPPSQNVTIVW